MAVIETRQARTLIVFIVFQIVGIFASVLHTLLLSNSETENQLMT